MNTNMIDRYLHTVRFWLPDNGNADDIIAELREDLMSQIDGRDLSDDDLAALLKRRGEPSFVASQFGQHKPLIAAEWMPIYWFVVQLVVLRILVPVFVLLIGPIEWLQTKGDANAVSFILRELGNLFVAQIFAAGAITTVFALLQRTPFRVNWDPRKLPPVPTRPARGSRQSKGSLIVEMVAGVIGSCVWIAILRSPEMASITIATVRLEIAPMWLHYIWPILVLTLASVMLNWFLLAWPMRLEYGPWLRVAIDAANLAILCAILLHGPPWIEASVAAIENVINASMTLGFIVAILVSSWELMLKIRTNLRSGLHAPTLS